MANPINYIAYVLVNGLRCGIEIAAQNPDEAMEIAVETIKDIPQEKVGQVRLCDSASGLFIRGYS